MNKELEDQTKKKFNLSPDQWDAIPPMARDALAGIEVKVVEGTKEDSKWIPCSEVLPLGSFTVISTDSIRSAIDSANHVFSSYYDGEEWHSPGGERLRSTPTHWCYLPGGREYELRNYT